MSIFVPGSMYSTVPLDDNGAAGGNVLVTLIGALASNVSTVAVANIDLTYTQANGGGISFGVSYPAIAGNVITSSIAVAANINANKELWVGNNISAGNSITAANQITANVVSSLTGNIANVNSKVATIAAINSTTGNITTVLASTLFGVGSLANITTSIPSSSSAAGDKGQVSYNSGNVYICVATNSWIRFSANATF